MNDRKHVYAHSLPDFPKQKWETLDRHLSAVGEKAASFANVFSQSFLAKIMGNLHDIGKCSNAFQSYIGTANLGSGQRGPDHSTAGAVVALQLYGAGAAHFARLMAYGIAGHHAGLMDGVQLRERERKKIEDYAGWQAHVRDLPDLETLKANAPAMKPNAILPHFTPFFLGRMLFSCLVDADSLETERFYANADGRRAPARGGVLRPEHVVAVRAFMATHRRDDGPVNALRSRILDHALGKVSLPPGLFTLTVPTGGGKTLSSLSFALEHAVRHGLRRVVCVIPFTSVIEQTAQVFRDALGPALADDVLEHHASFDWEATIVGDQEGEGGAARARLQRDAENWDAPIIVTTAVQFFESLFAARRSRARKLHNLADSVIIIDEAQTIPVHLLRPSLAAIDELARNYGASVVLCTATQPALRLQDEALPQTRDMANAGMREGLSISCERELAPNPPALYRALRRVGVEWRQQPVSDDEIADRFAGQAQMLCIVNSRAHARALFDRIAHLPGACHLTTLMCAAHRRKVLAQLRHQLLEGACVRLVATSLIEAGVDISFPEVWRAATGLASIAQAAGRCNRNAELDGLGQVVVFEPAEHRIPPAIEGFYAPARAVLRAHAADALDIKAIQSYFRALYWQQGYAALDQATLNGKTYPIVPALREAGIDFPYRSIADAYRFIEDVMEPVLIPFDDAARTALTALADAPLPPAGIQRRLQPYLVPVPARVRSAMLAGGLVTPVRPDCGDRFVSLVVEDTYDLRLGLRIDPPEWRASEQNIL